MRFGEGLDELIDCISVRGMNLYDEKSVGWWSW
jgi:hypothetical protein